jgi:hypothetical protein
MKRELFDIALLVFATANLSVAIIDGAWALAFIDTLMLVGVGVLLYMEHAFARPPEERLGSW